MQIIMQVVIMAILVEAFWETLKMVWQSGKIEFNRIGALVVGMVVAFTLGVDIFVAIGLNPMIGGVGIVGTGILISRGSNFIHDLFKKVEEPTYSFEEDEPYV